MGFFAVLSGISAVAGLISGKKASDKNKDANKMQAQINKFKNRQEIRAFLRNYRQQQADALAAGVFSGIGLESSSVQGARSSLQTQARTGTREAHKLSDMGAQVGGLRASAAKYNFNAGLFNTGAQIASSFNQPSVTEPEPPPPPPPSGGTGGARG
jgi:hypothetical protein